MNSLDKLNKIIESVNIDITDENISELQNQVSKLVLQFKSNIYRSNKAVTSLFKMLEAISKYFGAKKENVHADTIALLNSIVGALEKIINDPELSKNIVNKILSKEIEKFKLFKTKIASGPVISKDEINELKSSILAIDWEVSDTTIQNFEKIVNQLLIKLKSYKISYAFLKILQSIVQYIGTQKANAHPDSISFLHSVSKNFEHIVQNPGMGFKEKKQFLDTEINNFQAFKKKISLGNNRVTTVEETHTTEPIEDDLEDESFAPALSQFKKSSAADTGSDLSLTTLSKADEAPQLLTQAAEENKSSIVPPQTNIMDDLFTVKESPADELLDAIHMLDVRGENPAQTMDMLDEAEGPHTDGVKKFTPQTKTNAPIPEIENRLDQFFNLNPSENIVVQEEIAVSPDNAVKSVEPSEPVQVNELIEPDKKEDRTSEDQNIDSVTAYDTDEQDDIVIFEDEDEDDSFEEIVQQYDDNLKIIAQLKLFFDNTDWVNDKSSLSSINQHISFLENGVQNDPEKNGLLEIIKMNIDLLKNINKEGQPVDNDNKVDGKLEDTPKRNVETPGIWNKIKKILP